MCIRRGGRVRSPGRVQSPAPTCVVRMRCRAHALGIDKPEYA